MNGRVSVMIPFRASINMAMLVCKALFTVCCPPNGIIIPRERKREGREWEEERGGGQRENIAT